MKVGHRNEIFQRVEISYAFQIDHPHPVTLLYPTPPSKFIYTFTTTLPPPQDCLWHDSFDY